MTGKPLDERQARVAELVDAAHSKCVAERRVGSSPTMGTMLYLVCRRMHARVKGECGVIGSRASLRGWWS